MATYTVIYDACVLYPAPLRDILVELATANLFRAKWTEKIHEEWIRSLLVKRLDLTRAKLERTKELMNNAVLNCVVTDYEYLIPAITLPDEDDRHIAAAAIHAGADAIITFNVKDFPVTELAKYNLEAVHPDEFINYQLDLDEAAVLISAQRCRKRLLNPPSDPKSYLNTLEALQLPKSIGRLRRWESIL